MSELETEIPITEARMTLVRAAVQADDDMLARLVSICLTDNPVRVRRSGVWQRGVEIGVVDE